MRGRVKAAVAGALVAGAAVAGTVAMADGGHGIRETLTGYQEDPLTLSTTGTGDFQASIKAKGDTIRYRLSYADLEGTVQQAHIHLGQRAQSGGIAVFLCTNLGNGPVGTQACPARAGHDHGDHHPGRRHRPGGAGHRRGRVRRAHRRRPRGRDLRQRAQLPVPGGRDPRPAGAAERRPVRVPPRARR